MVLAESNAPSSTDPAWFRRVLGQYPTGVCAVTGIGPDGRPVGMVVGSFTSVSLDPPLVAFLASRESASWRGLRLCPAFCVNVLAADQEHVCRAFSARDTDKYAHVTWTGAPSGSPTLGGAVAWIDCRLDRIHDAGDHEIVLGRVTDLGISRPAPPLLFHQGAYGRFSPH